MRHRVLGAAVLLGALAVSCGTAAAPVAAPAATTPAATTPAHTTHPAPTGPVDPLEAGQRFSALRLDRAYAPQPPAGATDEYRCFLVDPGLRSPAVLVGSRFEPSNADIVHHAIFYRVAAEDVGRARTLDGADDGDGWTCFGGTGINGGRGAALAGGSDWVAAWAPGGSGEVRTPAGTGYRLDPGGQLVMQVHYNLLRAARGSTDRPGITLRFADPAAKLTMLRTTLLPAPVELPCAAGETGRLCDRTTAVLDLMRRFGTDAGFAAAGLNLLCVPGATPRPGAAQHCDHQVREPGRVYALSGHMHLLGTRITVELNPGTAAARTLLDVSPYDFHDQRTVPLPTPVAVEAGDTLRVSCTHDAANRKHLAELKDVPPRYVVWGDGTTDEMCLGIVVRD